MKTADRTLVQNRRSHTAELLSNVFLLARPFLSFFVGTTSFVEALRFLLFQGRAVKDIFSARSSLSFFLSYTAISAHPLGLSPFFANHVAKSKAVYLLCNDRLRKSTPSFSISCRTQATHPLSAVAILLMHTL